MINVIKHREVACTTKINDMVDVYAVEQLVRDGTAVSVFVTRKLTNALDACVVRHLYVGEDGTLTTKDDKGEEVFASKILARYPKYPIMVSATREQLDTARLEYFKSRKARLQVTFEAVTTPRCFKPGDFIKINPNAPSTMINPAPGDIAVVTEVLDKPISVRNMESLEIGDLGNNLMPGKFDIIIACVTRDDDTVSFLADSSLFILADV